MNHCNHLTIINPYYNHHLRDYQLWQTHGASRWGNQLEALIEVLADLLMNPCSAPVSLLEGYLAMK